VPGGGVPPHDEAAEASVLGAIMLADRWLDTISVDVRLRAEDFYRPRHRLIFQAMIELNSDSEPIDSLTVANRLTERGNLEDAGGKDYVETLVTRIPAIGNTKQYAQIVKENALLRGLIQASHDIQTAVSEREGDPQQLVERAQQLVFDVAQDTHTGELVQLASILHEQIDALEQQALHGSTVTGTPTGFRDIDELTGGLQGGNLVIVAARPAMGKSALVTNIAENAALEGYPVAIFSMEMSKNELSQRFISSQAKISGDAMRKGQIKKTDWPKVLSAAQEFDQAPIWIDDSSDINITELRAKARRLHGRYLGEPNEKTGKTGLGLIIVDYLQLLRASDGRDSRVEQVAQMSRGLKILARELDVPVIAVSQLSRAVESRTPPRPQLSDLRECVTGDTLVNLADGRRVPIQQLVGETPTVLTNDNGRIVAAESDCVWRVGRKEVFELTFASGRRIRATAKHRMLTGRGWLQVSELCDKERMAVASEIPEPSEPVEWSDARVAFLGQMIGDGSYLSGQPMRFTSATDENSSIVAEAATAEFGCRVTRYDHRPNWHQLLISGNGTRWKPAGANAWLRELGIFNQRSGEKRIPDAAFQLATRQVALLLKHLWATDGSIWVGIRADGRRMSRVAYSTSSPGLASDVSALLLRLGIVARISTVTEGTMHHVTVSGRANQLRFAEQIGAFGPRRAQLTALEALLGSLTQENTNVDTLPLEVWSDVKREMQARGISQRAMAASRNTSYGGSSHFKFAPSRSTLRSYAELLESPSLHALTEAEIFWDSLVSVEPCGIEEVYDLTVPGTANWIANEGIVTHNSGQIEQDADVVCFIYREEYYLKDESERPGIADVIFAKHRNGPVGDVELTFLSHYPKFTNKPKGYGGEGGSGDAYQAARVSDSHYVEEESF
jgi:replicative DNA helicase